MKTTLWLICFFFGGLVYSQPTHEIGLLIGGASYLGDLVESDAYPYPQTIRPAIAFYGGKSLSYTLQVRANLSYAGIEGNDDLNTAPVLLLRNFSFESELFELGVNLVWEPFAKKRFPSSGGWKTIISPYVFVGGAMTLIKGSPQFGRTQLEGYNEKILADLQQMPSKPQFTIPFGGGFRVDMSEQTSLGLEMGWHRSNSDYLDGISVAGNSNDKDWYIMGGVTLSYRFKKPDSDRDGIYDSEDRCPLMAGEAIYFGCPDVDLDGIPDMEDMCPYQYGRKSNFGCPDSDYDGLPDLLDDCPDIHGEKSAQGCPDKDEDGITDLDDLCPSCWGEAESFGCPDADKDGTPDYKDRCQNIVGKLEWNGCPYPDTDLDGIADTEDHCPEQKGSKAFNGCPDSDEDGVPDYMDDCPEEKGEIALKGCQAIPDTIKEILIFVTEAVQFETASATLLSTSLEKLDQLVRVLENYPLLSLRIEGHTDSHGLASKNRILSEDRAKACKDYLEKQGVANERMQFDGLGEDQPIATNKTAAGRRKNRRVTFQLE